jgi:hypothetical protein
MLIDFGNGEAIMARHEEYTLQGLEAWALRQQARQGRAPGRRLSHLVGRLRCDMDYWRLVLAERLDRFALAQSILHAEDTSFFSTRQCK